MKRFYTIVLLAAILLGQGMQEVSGQNKGNQRFNLPPVNLDVVPDDAYEPGKIQVQFREEMADKLTSTLIRRGPGNQVALSNANLDNLNRRFAVREYKSMLHNMYQQARVPEQARQRHRQYGFHLLYEISLGEGTNVKEAVRAFEQLPEVEYAEPVYRKVRINPVSTTAVSPFSTGGSTTVTAQEWQPNDTFYGVQYALNNTGQSVNGTTGTAGADISAQEAWAITKGNPDVIVAVIDEGVQYNHPDLAGNMWPGIGIEGTSTIAGGHGTHVAGTIAAVSNNNTGVAGVAGGDGSANSGVRIMSLDMFNGAYKGNVYALNVYAADNGAAVSQNSWGYTVAGVYNSSDLRGIDYFNTQGGGGILQGGVSIFAAGNDNSSSNWYPAYYSGAFSVASTDNKDLRSYFSNYGTWIDVSAPGSVIRSTYTGSSYAYMSGTSMACPHVSGVAALVLSYVPGKLTNSQLLEIIKNNTDNIDTKNPSYTGLLGTGRINAYKALVAAGAYAGGVNAPASLAAQAVSSNEISLSWQSNTKSDPVLLAWSADGVFGTPLAGTTYSAGNLIPGGGTVLYAGNSQTNLVHSGLDALTSYHYRAWAYNSDAVYSQAKSAIATTLCPEFAGLPFLESFTGLTAVPSCWSTSGTKTWGVGTFANGLSGTGNYAWTETTGKNASTAHLVSPAFNFTGLSDVRLQFTHQYNHDLSSATLAYSLNNGSSWTTVQTWTANTGTVNYNQVIAALAGRPDVTFRWTLVYNGGGRPNSSRSWSVDNIQVSASAPALQYTINASAGTGGSIDPSGNIKVNDGASQTFTIAASSGYEIADVLVNGSSVGIVSSYTFTNVISDHSLAASFSALPTYTITASAGTGGSISPSGTVTITKGGSQTFTITPSSGYEIADVKVKNVSVGAVSSYTFTNVISDQTIAASFSALPTYTITASAGTGGSISPSGTVTITKGGSQTFAIIASSGYEIADVKVNGGSVGPVSSYTFNNVISNQTILAEFKEGVTDPCAVAILPYSQDFSDDRIPACWSTIAQTGNIEWSIGRVNSGGLNLNSGNYAYAVFSGTTIRRADLISPPFDFTGYTGLSLTFEHYYLHGNSAATVYYSADSGSSWIALQAWTKSTSNPSTATINLSSLNGLRNVIFKWELNYTGGGKPTTVRSWFIDNVKISGTGSSTASLLKSAALDADISPIVEIEPALTVYPNPAADRVFVSLNVDVTDARISILDLLGREVRNVLSDELRIGDSREIDVSGLEPGIYFIRLTGDSIRLTGKVTVKR